MGGWSESWSVVSDSLQPHRLYRPWNSPWQNNGEGSFSLLQGIFPTQGSNPGLLHCRQFRIRWPKYRSFCFSICSSSEYSGLISFKIDWFDLLVVRGTLKSLLQHHNSKASILWRLAFFMVRLSHSYMTTGKAIAFTIGTFVGQVMSLLFKSQNVTDVR